jgi:transcriptional regulator with XRE-family HTH domain
MGERTRSNGRDLASSTEPDPKAVGRRIALARKEAGGMTQRDLAEVLQISTRSVAAYEAGAVLPLRHLDKIETAVSKPKAWLLYGNEALPNPSASLEKLEGMLDSITESLDRMNDRLEQLPHRRVESLRHGEGHGGNGAVLVDDLNRLVELRYQEMISEAEFAAAKALLFGLDRRAR